MTATGTARGIENDVTAKGRNGSTSARISDLPPANDGRMSRVTIVLDAAPNFVIPASVSYVASTAQFTPKTVETANERQKLMFRVRAQIPKELLVRHREQVKTGLPGVAWLRIDPNAAWPQQLAVKESLQTAAPKGAQ